MVTQTYQKSSRELLAQGRDELARGEVRQASEKGWDATALMVKAIAERHGWENGNEAALFTAVSHLVSETDDDDIRRLFSMILAIYIDFYGWYGAQDVSESLDDVERFLDKLEPLAS